MAKRQQVTKLLAVMVMTASPAMAGPEHDHGHAHKAAKAEARPAATPAASPAASPAGGKPTPALPAAAHAPARPQPIAAAPTSAPSGAAGRTEPQATAGRGAASIDALLVLFGISKPRELPNGRPAPGNVSRRTSSRSER